MSKILIIDDEADDLSTMGALLDKAGHKVTTTPTGGGL